MFYLVSVSSCRLGWCVCSAVCRSTVMKREREREERPRPDLPGDIFVQQHSTVCMHTLRIECCREHGGESIVHTVHSICCAVTDMEMWILVVVNLIVFPLSDVYARVYEPMCMYA